jgi:hypothetical protein
MLVKWLSLVCQAPFLQLHSEGKFMRFQRKYLWGLIFGILVLLGAILFSWFHFQPPRAHIATVTHTTTPTAHPTASIQSVPPEALHLDSRIPVQTYPTHQLFRDLNAAFGSRFDFTVDPHVPGVWSGTGGVFHDNLARYIVGIAPFGKHMTSIFHWGSLNSSQGDSYVLNERWTLGLDTSRWEGDASDSSGMHITVDIINPFFGASNCTVIAQCASAVKDDTLPVLLIGVSLHNSGSKMLAGTFLFGSNRSIAESGACIARTTPGGMPVNVLSYETGADSTGGTLFMAGQQSFWDCNTSVKDRAGLAWLYTIPAGQTQTAYMLVGGWNTSQNLFVNTHLPAGCQQEVLYATQEWASENAVVDFTVDNLSTGDNLLGRAQAMENFLINNAVLMPAQRWVIADTLRSYEGSSWLAGRQSCAGGGYDVAVYEGTFGNLSTVDVLHEYGYFEINRMPWFFRKELEIIFAGALNDSFGTYFRHEQGFEVNSAGACVRPGHGMPAIRDVCSGDIPSIWGTEENSDVALLTAFYVFSTGDASILAENGNLGLLNATMLHNQKVGDPRTGIAYNGQDTGTTYDDQPDCLRNAAPNAGNLYYQGLKEAAAYRATSYLEGFMRQATAHLDGFIPLDPYRSRWINEANKIENAIVHEFNTHGFIPLAENNDAFTNCSGRSVVLGEGLFYLHLIGLDDTVNPQLLQDLARQYPGDLQADTLVSPPIVMMQSTRAVGGECIYHGSVCGRVEWFSKAMLSSAVADLIYTRYGCDTCRRIDVSTEVYHYNVNFQRNYCDGIHDDGNDWIGYQYPRGIISWIFLNPDY